MPKKIGLIGYTGFVGSHIRRFLHPTHVYNSKNSEDMRGEHFNLLVCCGISAVKWKANKDPETDWKNIADLIDVLEEVTCDRFVLISTIDVYGPEHVSLGLDEDALPNDDGKLSYGTNRLRAEAFLSVQFAGHIQIVRLCGLFGYGLKKNIIFDWIHNRLKTVDVSSSYQWYSMEWLERDLLRIMKRPVWDDCETFNLFTEPLPTSELMDLLENMCPSFGDKIERTEKEVPVRYNTCTRHSKNGTAYWEPKRGVLAALQRYVGQMVFGKVVVSNLCTREPTLDRKALLRFGVREIEVAPNKHFSPFYEDKPLSYFKQFQREGIYSFQSLFYPHKWKLDEDFERIEAHLRKLVDIAELLGAKVLVFGSPKLRSVPNASLLFAHMMRFIDTYIGNRDVTIAIEPNAEEYKCEFLTTSDQVHEFLETKLSECRKIGMMLDVGCMTLQGENVMDKLEKYADRLAHVHFSAPHLKSLASTNIPFAFLCCLLQKNGYSGKITIEMLNVEPVEIEDSIHRVVKDPSFGVIGGGWFGCHLVSALVSSGYPVSLFERDSLLHNASSKNQNRLHKHGLHYVRSYKTRQLCSRNYKKFMAKYAFCVRDIDANLYGISNKSLVDSQTFLQVMRTENKAYELKDPEEHALRGVEAIICSEEKFIDWRKAKARFAAEHGRILETRRASVQDATSAFDFVIDCSYNELGVLSDNCFPVYTLSLVYEKVREKEDSLAITIVDGPFCSIYPFDMQNHLYTLTHVTEGILETDDPTEVEVANARSKMEWDMAMYFPEFCETFKYSSHFVTKKWKLKSACDDRSLATKRSGNMVSFLCGKIPGIFDAERHLRNYL